VASLTTAVAIGLLSDAAAELAGIRRAKHYMMWRADNVDRLGDALVETEPFKNYANTWVFTESGSYRIGPRRFGDWAISRLVAKAAPMEILAGFEAEVQRNCTTYVEVSPVFGVQIDRKCQLAEGVTLVPHADATFLAWGGRGAPQNSCYLCQSFEIKPAFEFGVVGSGSPQGKSVAKPKAATRDAIRQRLRLSCLLASSGAIELPVSLFDADDDSLFAAELRSEVVRPMSTLPQTSFSANEELIETAFGELAGFQHQDSLARAIDRLGRSRLASSPVDRALELGMAAEIALMHGESSGNTEIAHKIGGRAAWLLGGDADERAKIFGEMKLLYQARSQAVHSGALSPKSKVNMNAGDILVARTLAAILKRGHFPDWSTLVMGGG
jgi:hypothetical protein